MYRRTRRSLTAATLLSSSFLLLLGTGSAETYAVEHSSALSYAAASLSTEGEAHAAHVNPVAGASLAVYAGDGAGACAWQRVNFQVPWLLCLWVPLD